MAAFVRDRISTTQSIMFVPTLIKFIIRLFSALICCAAVSAGAQTAPDPGLQLAQATGLRLPAGRGAAVDVSTANDFEPLPEQSSLQVRALRHSPADARRLGLADTEARSISQFALGESWISHFAVSSVAPGDPLSRQTVHGQFERTLPGGWGVGFGLRRNDYSIAASNALSVSAERQWGDFRGTYLLVSGLPEGQSFESHRFALSYQYADRSSFGLAYTNGRDIDYLASVRGLAATDINNWSLGGLHRLTPAWALTYDLLRGTQTGVTPRQGLRLGLRHDF